MEDAIFNIYISILSSGGVGWLVLCFYLWISSWEKGQNMVEYAHHFVDATMICKI